MAGRPALSWAAVSSSAPSKDSPPASDSSKRRLAVALAALAALAYGHAHLNWYLGTPLGRVPVLDERENLDLANAIAAGGGAPQPLYPAPRYAPVLPWLPR